MANNDDTGPVPASTAGDPPNGSPQDIKDIIAIAKRVASDCADVDDLNAAHRILERLGV